MSTPVDDPCTTTTAGVPHLIKEVSDAPLIIVRDEYLTIASFIQESAVKLTSDSPGSGISRGLVVWGHPGIGKSLFLLSTHTFLYFDETGVAVVKWADTDTFKLPLGVVALYDTVVGQDSPHGRFTDRLCRAYVVHATSPKISRWKEWAKQLRANVWPMPLWSNAELRKLEQEILYQSQLAAFLGPSPRKCSADIETENKFEAHTPLDFTDGSALYNAPTSGEVPETAQGLNFHLYFFAATIWDCGPRPADSNPRDLLSILHPHTLPAPVRAAYVPQYDSHPQLCGAFYEVLGLQFVQMDGLLCRFPDRLDADGNDERTSFMPGGFRILQSDDDEPVDPSEYADDVRLWIPPANFPSVDAVAILDHGKLIRMLQLTIAHQYDIKSEGVARVIIKFSAVPGVRFEFLFITTSAETGKRMARTPSQHQPYALRVKTAGRQPPVEKVRIPVGYAVAEFIKPEDLLVLHATKENISHEPANPLLFDDEIEIDTE
ncbi:hypothetical protein B0H17DRAFT_1175956 [Mycena rosella]|uniref:Uncharacterized protein n=1 Tax=Mycena rosella TaxID=1033263 RepID=A0AAD7DZA2_MYCRO|nr:hypothetical protein B0H17DRAFT_1175956 [Mycena rosella]